MYLGRATKFFHGEEGYNCAQAVLATYKDRYNFKQDLIDSYRQFGGGRAEENTCGAIYAIREIVKDERKYLEMRLLFSEKASSYKCKEIKQLQKLSCLDCVKEVVKLIENL